MSEIATQFYDRPGGKLLLDMTGRVINPRFATNERGFHDWSGFVPMAPGDAFRWYDLTSGHLVVSWGALVLYQGRVEDPETRGENRVNEAGLQLVTFGYSQAYSDVPIAVLYSTMRTDAWEPVTVDQINSRFPERYGMSTDGSLRIAPQTGEAFDSTHIGSMTYAIPHGSAKQIIQVDFDYEAKMQNSTWKASLSRYNDAFGFLQEIWSITGTGAVQTGTQSLSIFPCDRLVLNLLFNRPRTTLGTTIAAGTRTVTPGSMTGIVVGSVLKIGNNGGAVGSEPEDVEVTAVTATQFTAVFRTAHNLADTVSFVYTGESEVDCYLKITNIRVRTTNSTPVQLGEIATDLATYVDAINPTQIDNVTSWIQSTNFDLKEAVFEDMTPAAILDELCAKGDSQGRRWEWKVWDFTRLRVQPEGTGGKIWYVDATPALLRSISEIENSAYALYQDAAGRIKRTAVASDAGSVAAFGLIRRGVVDAQTTNLAEANQVRDTYIKDKRYNGSLGEFEIDFLRTSDGAIVPGWNCRSGDTIVIRGYPSGSAQSIDWIRAFPVFGTDFRYGIPGDRRQLGKLKIISTRLPQSLPGLLARRG